QPRMSAPASTPSDSTKSSNPIHSDSQSSLMPCRLSFTAPPPGSGYSMLGLYGGQVCCASDGRRLDLSQEVEIAAVLGLEHVVHVELGVAARRRGDRRFPVHFSFLQFRFGNREIDL